MPRPIEGQNEPTDGLDDNRRRAFVGTVADYEKNKGWFFGSFVDNPLLRSNLVEVAWQKLPGIAPSADQEHFHKATVEIDIVIKGSITLDIDGVRHTLDAGQCYVIWPESVVSNITTTENTELIVVRAPSIPSDKFAGSPADS